MSTDINIISLSSQTDSNTKTASAPNSSPAVNSTKKDCSTDNTLPDKGKKSFDDVLETAKESKKTDTTELKAENKEVKTTADKTAGTSIATELAAAMQQQCVVTNTDVAKSDGKTVFVENPVISALLKAEASTGTASSATAMPVPSGQKQSTAVQTEQTGISSGSNTQSSIQKVVQQNVQGSLDALLPQNESTASAVNANQQLMQMLSSKNSGLATLQQTIAAVPVTQETSRQMTAESSVVGSTVMAEIKQPILQENTALLQTVGKQNTVASKKGTDTAKTAVLGGQSIQMTVEDHTNLLGQMQQNVQPLQHQTLQNAVSEQPVVTAVSAHVQLPEEAIGDTEATSTKKVDSTPSSSQQFVTAFQQSLQPTDGTTTQASAGTSGTQQTAAAYNIPGQIVDQAKLIKSTEGTEMVIKLKPEYLGELTLKISVTADGAVNASFHSDNAQVRNIIETSMVQLRQDLQAQGLKVDNVGVYAGLSDGFFANSQSNQPRQQQKPSTRNQKIDLVDFEDTASTLSAAVNSSLADDGVDYRV